MVKAILYTSNPDFVPNNLEQIRDFAEENNKYYRCLVNEESKLKDVRTGAHILTTKGNNVYVLDVDTDNAFEFAKSCNITGVLSVDYPFGKPKANVSDPSKSITGFIDRMKSLYSPEEADDVRITIDGNIAVAATMGYVAIKSDNTLVSYPEEATIELPVLIMSKPANQLQVGDIVALPKGYAKVTFIKGDKIGTITYNGASKTIRSIKDFLFGQAFVRVVVSLTGTLGGQLNPAMIMALSDKKDSLLPFLMMNQSNGALGMNPALLLALTKDNNGGSSFKDLLMMQALTGNNGLFNNLFAPQTVSQPVVNKQPANALVNEAYIAEDDAQPANAPENAPADPEAEGYTVVDED